MSSWEQADAFQVTGVVLIAIGLALWSLALAFCVTRACLYAADSLSGIGPERADALRRAMRRQHPFLPVMPQPGGDVH